MNKTKRTLCLTLILSIVFCGAFAAESECGSKGPCVKKKDFIPNRCILSDGIPIDDEYKIMNGETPKTVSGCVCFSDGTCEFKTGYSRDHWCYYGDAVSVNEGERCPDLHGSLLHVCPPKHEYYFYPQPLPVYEVYEAVPDYPILVAAEDAKQRRPAAKKQESLTASRRVAQPEPAILVAENPAVIADPIAYPVDPIAYPVDTIGLPVEPIEYPVKPIEPVRPILIAEPNGCTCTADGVCTKSYVRDPKSMCKNDENLIAIVENGPCPRSSACKLQAPKDTYICQDSDRILKTSLRGKICPQYFAPVYGCNCYQDGTCENTYGDSCQNCQDSNVVSVSHSVCECR